MKRASLDRSKKVMQFALVAAVFVLRAKAQSSSAEVVAIQAALESGDTAQAAQLLEKSIAQHPEEGGLFNLRGILHARREELPAARSDFAQAVHFNPQLTPAWQNLARACQQLGDSPCALSAWQHVLKAKPKEAEAHQSLARLYAQERRFADSLHALDRSPEDDLTLRLTDLLALGRIPQAKSVAAQLAVEPAFNEEELATMNDTLSSPGAASVLAELVEGLDARHAASPASLRRLVPAYEQLRRTDDAIRILERLASLNPNGTAELLELARLAEQRKNYEGALGYLAHARDVEPKNPRIHFLFGLIAGELNLPLEAKSSLEKAIALDPENPDYNFALGTTILQTRDAATATACFEKYLARKPADPRGHYALGLAQFAAAEYPKAQEQMHLAESNTSLVGPAEYYLGRIARLDGRRDEAKQHQSKAVAAMPQFSESHTELGRLALLEGDTATAQAELHQALQLAPESFPANEQLLILYRRTHDPRAEKQAETLKKLDQDRSKRAELMLRTIEVRP